MDIYIILDRICSFIDDPKTFINFSLINKDTRFIANLYKNKKMDQFSKLNFDSTIIGGLEYCKSSYTLPNGNLHGEKYLSVTFELHPYRYYYNGILVTVLELDGWNKIITKYKCNCIDDINYNYMIKKLCLDNRYLKSSDSKEYKCICCGIGTILNEYWIN